MAPVVASRRSPPIQAVPRRYRRAVARSSIPTCASCCRMSIGPAQQLAPRPARVRLRRRSASAGPAWGCSKASGVGSGAAFARFRAGRVLDCQRSRRRKPTIPIALTPPYTAPRTCRRVVFAEDERVLTIAGSSSSRISIGGAGAGAGRGAGRGATGLGGAGCNSTTSSSSGGVGSRERGAVAAGETPSNVRLGPCSERADDVPGCSQWTRPAGPLPTRRLAVGDSIIHARCRPSKSTTIAIQRCSTKAPVVHFEDTGGTSRRTSRRSADEIAPSRGASGGNGKWQIPPLTPPKQNPPERNTRRVSMPN